MFAISSGALHGLPIDAEQREELWVTAAQSAFAVAVLANRKISVTEAFLLLGLYLANLVTRVLPHTVHDEARLGVGFVYMVLAITIVVRHRRRVPRLLRDGFRTPYDELNDAEIAA